MSRPNTVAYSAGAVCCPDEASARRHHHATWFDFGGLSRNPVRHSAIGEYRTTVVTLPGRRWTR